MRDNKSGLTVAHIVGSLNVGGAERFVIDLCRTQKNNGEKPLVVSLGQPGEQLEPECNAQKITFFSSRRSTIFKFIQVFISLKKVDVVHIHSPHALKFLQVMLPFVKAKIIYTRHGAAPLKAEHWKKLHVKAQSVINAVTFVSKEGMEIFKKQHHWPDTSHHVIDNGVIINSVKSHEVSNGKIRLGSVGRMIPLKNQLSLLKAVKLLDIDLQYKIELHFFGDGECLEILRSYQKQTMPNLAVIFHGMVNDREKIYSNFDTLVVCSETEGLSMVIIEAMANKIPVIATNVGGNPKLVLDQQTGWLFEYDDNKKLAEIITSIVKNAAILAPIGFEAFNYISANFSIQSSAKKYLALYKNGAL
jgi:glycosyltransferase involved in cell wall biosynthesis